MFERKWCTYTPVGYVGMVVLFISMLLIILNTNSDSIIGLISMLMLIMGLALLIKGRKEHSL